MEPDPTDRFVIDRRYVLAVTGGSFAVLAGCAGGDDTADEEPEDTPEPDDDDDDDTGEDDDEEEDEDDAEEDDTEEDEEEVSGAEFSVVDVEHPDEVVTGEEHTIGFTIENTSDLDGTFEEVLEFSIDGEDQWENIGVVSIDVAAGDSESWESEPFDFREPATVQFRLGEIQWEYDVTITEPDAQSFAGTGQTVERGIDIEGGLVVVEASHDGERNFQVSLEDDSDFGDGFINEIGEFDGAQAGLVDEGEYLLDVTADGSWEVTIRQPRSGQGEELPVSFAGSGPDVVGPVRFDDTGVATGEHTGDRNFQVRIYPMTGSWGEGVFNEIGEFEGETTYSFDGIGWVDINADGSWRLGFE